MNFRNYDLVETYYPSYSDKDSDLMYDFLRKLGIEDEFWYESMYAKEGEYYLEWRGSEHERDSSQDCLFVWKRK